MMRIIEADLSAMFDHREPWDCSNSVANLGPDAGRLTWNCAMEVAQNHAKWLLTPVDDACEGMRRWARDTGAWDDETIAAWSTEDCLALFVQNIASEMRDHLDADNLEISGSVAMYADLADDADLPVGYYFERAGKYIVSYTTD